jgi:stage V sporulation protein S
MGQKSNHIELKVAASSNPSSVAGSIAKNLQEGKSVSLLAIGAGSVNQLTKAYAIARGYVAPSGMDLVLKGGFTDIEIEDKESGEIKKKTAIRMQIVTL